MGVFKCTNCEALFEVRCKPKKCENCGKTEFKRIDK
jgi:rubredoxin